MCVLDLRMYKCLTPSIRSEARAPGIWCSYKRCSHVQSSPCGHLYLAYSSYSVSMSVLAATSPCDAAQEKFGIVIKRQYDHLSMLSLLRLMRNQYPGVTADKRREKSRPRPTSHLSRAPVSRHLILIPSDWCIHR